MRTRSSEKHNDKDGSRKTIRESVGDKKDKLQWKESLEPLIELAKKIPGVESIILILTFILKMIGLKGLLGAIGGLIAVSGLIYFGIMPAKLVQVLTVKYEKKAVIPSPKPKHLDMRPIANKEFAISFAFLRPYWKWLQDEADSKSTKRNIICPYISEKFESLTSQFKLLLETSPGYEIISRAFIVRKDYCFKELEKDYEKPTSIEFSVPVSKKGDRLFIIISIMGTQKAPIGKCEAFFDFHYK